MRYSLRLLALVAAGLLTLLTAPAGAATDFIQGQVRVIRGEFHGSSHAIRGLPVVPDPRKPRRVPLKFPPLPESRMVTDPVVQSWATAAVPTTDLSNFLGVGSGFVGPGGAYSVASAPPDPIGAVGAGHYFQWVNTYYAVFDKTTHAVLAGPLPGNATWTGVNHACARTNDGDPVVLYDRAADRWILTQLSYSEGVYLQCISVSKTGDPTGQYWLYAFDWGVYLNDYPKLAVWTDAYYLSTNDFLLGLIFAGPSACAIRRETILNGQPTLMICYAESSSYSSLLPANLTGAEAPPAGAPGLFLGMGTNMLHLWRMTPDWAVPDSTVVTRTDIPVAAFNRACVQNCIPQPGTTQTLDVLGDRLMQPLVYRNFGDHGTLVANHSVLAGSTTGVRWYEIRDPHGSPAVFQQGTFAPDQQHRWMGSIGMDGAGNIAVGYSVGSSSLYPSIRYTGRESTDAPGVMQAENSIIEGAGSQLPTLNRWGDYSGMSLDPVDDCTFWYTTEYLQASGTFNWSTRIALFKFPSCGGGGGNTPPVASFTVSCTDLSCNFDASGSTDDSGIISYAWDFGDGQNGSGVTASHSYAAADTYTAVLTVTDGDGASDSDSQPVTVTEPPPPNRPPVANFTFGCTNLTCSFDGSSSTDDQGIVSYAWNFGDGQSGSGVSVAHAYVSAGTYNVTLTVTDTDGATDSEVKAVTVTAPPPVITLIAAPRKVKNRRFVDLLWSGAASANVDVHRNGAFLLTTPNDGAHTDQVGRPGSYTYRVCEQGTSVCSNSATATF